MADNLQDRGPADRSRVNVNEEWEVRWWTKKWGVTSEQLKAAVRAAGPVAADVAKKLGKTA